MSEADVISNFSQRRLPERLVAVSTACRVHSVLLAIRTPKWPAAPIVSYPIGRGCRWVEWFHGGT